MLFFPLRDLVEVPEVGDQGGQASAPTSPATAGAGPKSGNIRLTTSASTRPEDSCSRSAKNERLLDGVPPG